MRKSKFISRLLFTLSLLAVFSYASLYLYHKQKLNLNYLSFELNNGTSVLIPDVNKLSAKLTNSDDLNLLGLPRDLVEAFNVVISKRDFDFNQEISKDCFFSFNESAYVLALNTNLSLSSLLDIVNEVFDARMKLESGELNTGGVVLKVEREGNFILFSNAPIDTPKYKEKMGRGSADFIVLDQKYGVVRHILSDKYHFSLSEIEAEKVVGRTVDSESYFSFAPGVFDELIFYGSSRIKEDQSVFFKSANEESFDWLDDGVLYCKKDSFEILIAKQGDSRDLGLMLEEQSLELSGDSAQLNYFNIGKFKILPFKTSYNWTESIDPLDSKLKYYTEHQNFNVMTNTIPAMRWYLGLVQLGKMFQSNLSDYKIYTECLPESVHGLILIKTDSSFECVSQTYQKNNKKLVTSVVTNTVSDSELGIDLVVDFEVSIVPDNIQIVQGIGEQMILLSSKNDLVYYDVKGNSKWNLNLSSELIKKPQIVDFENDGKSEFVLFQENQIDVVDIKGESLDGFPVLLKGRSKAGLAVNYDEVFKYRLIVNIDHTVKVFSEAGELVDGWLFEGMSTAMSGEIYHVLADGKDIITFKDQNKLQYVLNRKGESRLENEARFLLENETDFVVGGMSNSLRKIGYYEGYIYNYYLLDGAKDSVKVDKRLNPIKIHWEYNLGKPLMIAEESDRLLIVDQFGYVKSEVLKPAGSNSFVGLVGNEDYGFVFADNTQNNIYLLNSYGKMMLPTSVIGSSVSTIKGDLLYTFSGISLKAFKIRN